MAYFLGRDVEVFITSETQETNLGIGLTTKGGDTAVQAMTNTGATKALAITNGISILFAANLENNTAVSGGRVADVTGIDLSISSTDEEEGTVLRSTNYS